jgi:ring-1,2-phenylacetyl-CoA epoxidase subunit PaaE
MAKIAPLSVKKIIKETADAISLVFDIPEAHKANFKFKAGQYITINKILDGKKIKRAYSLCTAPYEDALQVVIKRIQGGNFSVYATENIQENEVLEIGFPEGRFVLETNNKNQKHYIAFAAGSGITPIYSMLKEVLHSEPNSKFTLVYGNKTPENTIFYNQLNALAKNNKHFKLQYVFSQSNEENTLFGRIDASIVKLMLNRDKYNSFYICGPTEMTETIIATLVEKGTIKDNIHYELFTAKTEKDNQNMENTAITGKVKVTVLLDDEHESFEMDAKETVLKAALDNDIDAPYSCQGGICSSCIGKVTKGKVKMLKNEILTEKEIEDGLTLTCQAVPETNEIIIDFDNL